MICTPKVGYFWRCIFFILFLVLFIIPLGKLVIVGVLPEIIPEKIRNNF